MATDPWQYETTALKFHVREVRRSSSVLRTLKMFDKNAPITNTKPHYGISNLQTPLVENVYGTAFENWKLVCILLVWHCHTAAVAAYVDCLCHVIRIRSPYQECLSFLWVWFDDAFLRLYDFNGAQVLTRKQLSLDLSTKRFMDHADSSQLQILPACQMRWSASNEFGSAWLIDSHEIPEYHIEAFEMRLRYVYTAAMEMSLLWK